MAHPITAFTNDIITETNFILPELPTIVLPARTLSHSITGAITNVNKELPAALDDHLSIRMRQVAQEIADEVTRQMYVISFLIFCYIDSVTGTQDLVVWKKMLIGDSSMHTPNLIFTFTCACRDWAANCPAPPGLLGGWHHIPKSI